MTTTDIVPIGATSERFWNADDEQRVARIYDRRLKSDAIDPEPGDGDLVRFADGAVHRFAGVGLVGNMLVAPCEFTDPVHGDFQLADGGDLLYEGLVFDTDDLDDVRFVDSNERHPAVGWIYHLGDPHHLEKVSFTIPVRVWTVDAVAPTSADLLYVDGR